MAALAVSAMIVFGYGSPAAAQSRDFMRNECSSVGQAYYRDFNAATEMRYNGQRTDGTHAINGIIYLENRSADFACSYERSGRRMVEFFADGRVRNAFLPGGGSGGSGGGATAGGPNIVRVTGIAANDVLNVRSGPGTSYRIIGALANGDSVRRLRCVSPSGSTWCEIEMLGDMRERGWVNARYLASGSGSQAGTATQLPSQPSVSGAGQTTTRVVRFPAGARGTEFTDQLAPGATRRYILNARARQFLYFRLASGDRNMSWRIQNPDSTLLDRQPASREYRGQLWQTGDHVIEVINASGRPQSYNIIFGIN